ncbi:hypothetical protein GGI05_000102 [Coemansia sp. RSA 2603]|nr:hypothetical protein GGI05_000102 [Coemansia sp. RSA 2603]
MAEKFLAKAHHAYSKAKADELDLSPGDIIRVTNDEHSSWWVGHNQMTNEQGWFPSNFVDRVKSSTSSKPKLKATRVVRIIKAYEAIDEDDLSLQVGDKVEVTKEVDGWFLGTLNGQSGMFPVSHAEEMPADEQTASRRPLPPTPGSSARRGTVGSNAPGASLPQPPAPSSSQQQQSSVPPALPSRNPPLPPRASTDVSRMSFVEENAEDSKKDKKSGHRISRLFTTKKHKNKEKEASELTTEHLEPISARSTASVAEEPRHNDEESEEDMISPALPSRPLPQPNIGAAGMTSPPPAARALPPIPGAPSAAKAPLPPVPVPAAAPPVPAAAPPVPAAAPPVPAAAPSVPPSAERRPSSASQQSTGPVTGAPLPPTASQSATLAEEANDAEAEPVTAEENDEGETDKNADEEAAEEAPAKVRGPAKLAKIISDYEATSAEELNLMSGDVVTIITRGTLDEPRWKGEYHGKKGYFPAQVVEEIEESGELEDDAEDSAAKPKGFKLAAYGVQQGGLGSLFAGSGMPALRKTARKPSESDDSAEAPAPAAAPVIPKLRSVQRPAAKDEQAKEEQQPNFLAQLSRVPRRSAPSDDSPSPAPMAAVPMLPISRKSTANSNVVQEPESEIKSADIAPEIVESDRKAEVEPPAPRSTASRSPPPAVEPTPIAKKPSFTSRSTVSSTAPAPASSVSSEWQKQVDDEHARLRNDIDRIQRTTDQQTDQLTSRLAASERENQAHRQTIAALEGQVQTATAQLAALKSDLASVQQALVAVGEKKSLGAEDVAAIVRSELESALAPFGRQNRELADENRKLHKMIADLRAYVDELVVEEEP